MLEFLQRLLLGHAHKWVERSITQVVNDEDEAIELIVVLRCSECGWLKNHKIKS